MVTKKEKRKKQRSKKIEMKTSLRWRQKVRSLYYYIYMSGNSINSNKIKFT